VFRTSELHLFLLWEKARSEQERILADVVERFRLVADVEITWPEGEGFTRSLQRFYGDALPPSVSKQDTSGSGPFRVLVVDLPRPRYRVKLIRRRPVVVNDAVYEARARYRDWTGGNSRVHGSLDPVEAERNLILLFGCTSEDVRAGALAERRQQGPLVGTGRWESVEQLLLALSVSGGIEVVSRTSDELVLSAADIWWTELVLDGTLRDDGARNVVVDGRPLRVCLLEAPPPSRFRRARAQLRERLAR